MLSWVGARDAPSQDLTDLVAMGRFRLMKPKLKVSYVGVDDVLLDPNNLRIHDGDNLASIRASLKEFGQVAPIVVHKDSNTVVGGNGTLQCIRELGWEQVATVVFPGTKKEARALAIALNSTTDKSKFDNAALAETLAELQEMGFNMDATGFTEVELSRMISKVVGELDVDMDDGGELPDMDEGDAFAPPAHVRMVQLFLNDGNIDQFMELTRKLAESYGADNLTDTVFQAVTEAHDARYPTTAAQTGS